MTLTMTGEATPEGGKREEAGSLVVLLDQWIAKDAPQEKAMAEFQRRMRRRQARHSIRS